MTTPVPQSEDARTVKVRTANDQLMRDMGSRNGGDPLPPTQYMYFLEPIKCSVNMHQVVAWLRWRCVRYRKLPDGATAVEGRRLDGRCLYAIDETGKALSIADMAREMDWDVSNATRYWEETESHRLCRKDESGRLCLEGNVPTARKPKAGEPHSREDDLGSYHLDKPSIQKAKDLPEEEYSEFLNLWKAADQHEQAWIAADIAEIRAKMARVKDAIKRRNNLPVRRLEVERKPAPQMPQMLLDFVESGTAEISVQTADPRSVQRGVRTSAVQSETENGQTTNRGSVPKGSSLLYSEPNSITIPAAAASLRDEARTISEALEIDAAAAASILFETRKVEPTITTAEIIELGREKLRTMAPQIRKGTVHSPTGILKNWIPQMAVGGPLVAARRRIAEAELAADYQRRINEATIQFLAEAEAGEETSPQRAEQKEREDRARIEHLRQIERELAQRKAAEDRKFFEGILANPKMMIGEQRFWTDEQIAEAEQWKLGQPEKTRTAGGGDP